MSFSLPTVANAGLVSIGMLHECKVKIWTGIRFMEKGMDGGLQGTAW